MLCAICRSQFDCREEVETLSCFHRFDADCIDQWFITKTRCQCHVYLNENDESSNISGL